MKRFPRSPEPDGRDVREMPIYSLAEAAFFLDVPKTTLHRWLRAGVVTNGLGDDPRPASLEGPLLSYHNLAELHILSVATRVHGVRMKDIKRAVEYIKRHYPLDHPLLSREFRTDGHDLFAKIAEGARINRKTDQVLNFSRYGQLGFAPVLMQYLHRIVVDEQHLPLKFYPVARGHGEKETIVCIMPAVSSGRPIVDKVGIPVSSLWHRYKAGDSVPDLADDYEIPEDVVRGALRYVEASAA